MMNKLINLFFIKNTQSKMKGKLKFDSNPIKNAKIYNLHLASIEED